MLPDKMISKNNRNRIRVPGFFLLLAIPLFFALSSCKIYSFSGGTLPGVKTFSVRTFTNQASLVFPSLSEKLTEKLKDKFMRDMGLKLVNDNGDINMSGIITDYRTAPSGISGQEKAATTRLTITVQVKFENTKDPKMNYDVSFSEYQDFNSSLNLSSIESGLVEQITDKLAQSIFNKSVSNW